MRRRLVLSVALLAAAFHLWAAGVTPFTALVQRPVHLALMASLCFLGIGWRVGARSSDHRGRVALARDAVLLSVVVASCLYLATQHESLVQRVGSATRLDLVAGAVTVLLVLELARRSCGWGLVLVALAALLYAVAGPRLPGILAHRGYGPARIVEHLYLSTEGIWGIPLGVSADFVYLFVLFGAVLEAAGGGQLLIALAGRVAGRTRGGPAKTASLASALMGSLSGSAVANVATTGSLTIPVMKRSGFQPHFAGAIEAAASTGGQLMPPVMGAGAFILATWTRIPYVEVAAAAAVPALLYYVALYLAIHFRAGKTGLEPGAGLGDVGLSARLADRAHLLLALGIIVVLLALGRSPMRAAFWGVVSAGALAQLRPTTRLYLSGWEGAVVAGASGTVQVAAACATAGIVVGVASLTGVGLRMSELIVTLADGRLPVALVLTALGSVILGMGLPTTAAYVVLAALGAPALTELGVPVLAAHLFIFYFGCISNVTPPVALAAYAAAGLAGSAPMRTAVTAMGLAAAGFLVPFLFVYGPALLLVGSPVAVALAVLAALAGVTGLAAAILGYGRRPLAAWERALLGSAALALLAPGLLTDVAGLALLAVVWWLPGPGPTGGGSPPDTGTG